MRDEILCTERFYEAFGQLVPAKQKITVNKIRLLLDNPESPSLRVHRYEGDENAWECYIDLRMRIIFEKMNGFLCLKDIGYHAILEKAHRRNTARYMYRMRIDLEETDTSDNTLDAVENEPAFFSPPVSLPLADSTQEGTPNYLQFFQMTHLRVLGVPAELIQSLRDAPSLDVALTLPGIPEHTRLWLEELSTSPTLAEVRSDSSRLLFRTTLDRLEGYCEGKIKQLMLNLQPELQHYVELAPMPLIVLKGMAGSGKTTVGIYRAIRLAEQGRSVLLLSSGNTLAPVITTLIEEMIGPLPDNLEVMTVEGLLAKYLGQRLHILEYGEQLSMQCLREAMAEVSSKEHVSVLRKVECFFAEEMRRVIKGQGITTLEAYKRVKRSGRKVALTSKQREIVWKVYEAYQRRLNLADAHDWADAASLFLQVCQQENLKREYDDIIIDEAQDLTCMELRAVRRYSFDCITDSGRQGSLMILHDAAQTRYARGFSWLQAGIQARGHTVILRANHRNTRQIAEAAAAVLQHNTLLRASQAYIDPALAERQGSLPILLKVKERSNRNAERFAQIESVKDHILDLVSDRTFRLSDFAIICRSNDFCRQCQRALRQYGLPATLRTDSDFHLLEEQIKVLTIQSARGLEFPVVFLMGMIEGELPAIYRLVDADEEEQNLVIEKERVLCYIGMTRAAEALYLLTVQGKESRFIQEMEKKITVWQ